MFGQRAFLRECYRLCAELEADVALARHLRGVSRLVLGRTRRRPDAGAGGRHAPAARRGKPLSLALDGKGAFISGQNGVGKSTFLRMLGLNLVAARAFGFCYARRASLPALPVVASMQNEDSLLDGQSLYVAELRARPRAAGGGARAAGRVPGRRDLPRHQPRGIGVRRSGRGGRAGAALAGRGVLAQPGAGARCWRSGSRPGASCARDGGLRLEPGVLGRTNGVALLAERGFDAGIQRKAEQVAAWLAGQRQVDAVLPG